MSFAGQQSRQAVGGFNPLLDLPKLLWFVHPDDATDIINNGVTGDDEINSIVDRFGGKTFSANAAANRMPLDTTERAPHNVADGLTNNLDWLRCPDPTLAQSLITDGGGAFTLVSSHRFSAAIAATSQMVMAHSTSSTSSGATSGNNSVGLFHSNAESVTLRIADTSATTFIWSAATGSVPRYTDIFSAWQTHIVTYDGAGTAELWLDGISRGIRTGTHRSPTGMIAAHYGGGGTSGNPLHHGVKFACASVLDAPLIAAVSAWIFANA